MSAQDWQENGLSYIGRVRKQTDVLTINATNCLLATLNDPTILSGGDKLPPLFHWIYFNEPVLAENLKADGHEKLGDFLPPVPYPKRMWAGSDVQFLNDLQLGLETTKTSTIKSVKFKTGSSGALCFVDVEHVYKQGEQECLIDVHTIVYKDEAEIQPNLTADAGISSTSKDEPYDQSVGAVTLFRYSALTFNAHLIHYDEAYAREEGYPGLVVHGPLMATLLMRSALMEEPNKTPVHFRFRGLAPVFAGNRFIIHNESADNGLTLQLTKQGDVIAMKAEVEWQS
jgi:3-methylfumaryl-CoA hydratase